MVEVTPETVVEMLGASAHPDGEDAGRTGRRRAAATWSSSKRAGRPASGALTLTGRWGRGRAGVRANRAAVAVGQRRTLRPRPGLPSGRRPASARAVGWGADRGGVGRGHGWGRAGVRVHRAAGPRRLGHDRRDHPLRPSAPGRRHRGDGCSRRTAAGWPASSCRGRTTSRSTRTSATARSKSNYVTQVDGLLELAWRPAPTAAEVAAAITPAGRVSGTLRGRFHRVRSTAAVVAGARPPFPQVPRHVGRTHQG